MRDPTGLRISLFGSAWGFFVLFFSFSGLGVSRSEDGMERLRDWQNK